MNMIPPFIKKDNVSNAEVKVFNLLKNLNINGNVLHSLGIANHNNKVYGEIDFVVITKQGVLALEVKGGRVEREKGVWYFIDKNGNENSNTDGPFNQAIGGMFSLRENIKKSFPANSSISKCQFACGVVFTDIIFQGGGPDIIKNIIFDERYTDDYFAEYIKKCFDYWQRECLDKHKFIGGGLSNDNIKNLSVYLRSNFKAIPTIDNILNGINEEIVIATDEQIEKLEMIDTNDRAIVEGGAGTGKSFIALEYAKRVAVTGKRVLYLCYNKLLEEYIEYNIENMYSNLRNTLEIRTFHTFLLSVVKQNDSEKYVNKNLYYEEILPEKFLEVVGNDNNFKKYDLVIIDEAQDLLKSNYMMCIDEILKGGLDNGKWYVFYDANQNLYNSELEDNLNEIEIYRPTKVKLNTNCRNTQQVGIYNTLITGIRHEKYIKVNGQEVVIEKYNNQCEQVSKVVELVKQLRKEGVNERDIVILSPYSFENSCFKGINPFRSICTFQNVTNGRYRFFLNDGVKFSTIHSFKGLESRVIILVDIDNFDNEGRRLLNYTGISRSKGFLYLFYDKSVENQFQNMIIKGFNTMEKQLV